MAFKPGQRVIIYKLFNLKYDGAATILRQILEGADKDKYIVEIATVGCAIIEEDRLIDESEYWRKQKHDRDLVAKGKADNSES